MAEYGSNSLDKSDFLDNKRSKDVVTRRKYKLKKKAILPILTEMKHCWRKRKFYRFFNSACMFVEIYLMKH